MGHFSLDAFTSISLLINLQQCLVWLQINSLKDIYSQQYELITKSVLLNLGREAEHHITYSAVWSGLNGFCFFSFLQYLNFRNFLYVVFFSHSVNV